MRIARPISTSRSAARLREVWRRYRLPLAVTEVHNGCTREEQLRWLIDIHDSASSCAVTASTSARITVWALIGSIDWNVMLTRRDGHYECGLFDSRRCDRLRPTALAKRCGGFVNGHRSIIPSLTARVGGGATCGIIESRVAPVARSLSDATSDC